MFGRRNKHADDELLSEPPTADLDLLGQEGEPSPVDASQLGSNHAHFQQHFADRESNFDEFFDGDAAHDPDNQIARDLR